MAGPGSCFDEAKLDAQKKDSIYHQVNEFLAKGETLAVATIVSTKGSTPREVGDISSDSPAVCGGVMNIFIDPWWQERDQEAAGGK